MKYLFLIIFVLVVSCYGNDSCDQNNIELVKKYYKAVNSGNVSNPNEIVTESFTKINNDKKFDETGIQLFVNSIRNHQRDNKEYKFIINDIFGNNDKVSVRWTWESINIKSDTEKRVVSQGIAIFEIKNHKINKLWQVFDLLDFTKQLTTN